MTTNVRSLKFPSSEKPINILTIDVEDWYHGISRYIDVSNPVHRLESSIQTTIDLLKESNAKATFFVLGEVANRFPQIVEQIISEGHEVGCHGLTHRHLSEIDPSTFNKEIMKATKILQKTAKTEILSFRAPLFSVTKSTLWALDVISKNGYLFDSSIVPSFHPFYGIPNEPQQPHYVPYLTKIDEKTKRQLVEFPILTQRIMFFNLAVGGGAYLRFLGKDIISKVAKNTNNRGWPAVLYIHPWELDTYIPHANFNPAIRFITFYNISNTSAALRWLLKKFTFTSIQDYMRRLQCHQ
jgi:peptidoglycan-N-acetylglucosamine deacetylase